MVNPPFLDEEDPVEPLGLECIAAPLRKAGYDVEVLDAPSHFFDYQRLSQEILARQFSVLGVTIPFQGMLAPALSLIDNLRTKGVKAHITIGAHPPTFTFTDILKKYRSIDSVIRGEGEYTLLELVKKVCANSDWHSAPAIAYNDNGQIITTPLRPLIKDLDKPPWPIRDPWKNIAFPSFSISSSRGCYGSCSFCSISAFYRQFSGPCWRARKAEPLINEVEKCCKDLKTDKVFFVDDNFIGPGKVGKNRARSIANEILKRKLEIMYGIACRSNDVDKELFALLKQSGLRTVFLGIESSSQEILDIFNKKMAAEENKKAIKILQELGIDIVTSLITINPYSTIKTIAQDINFLRETNCGPRLNHIKALEVLSGMPLVQKLKDDNLLRGTPFDYRYDFADKSVEKVANYLVNQFRPQLSEVRSKIQQDFRLMNEFKKLFNDYLDIVLNLAGKEGFDAKVDKQFKELIKPRLDGLLN